MWKMGGSITDVPGVLVGHAEDPEAKTGCTVALFEGGATAGVDVRGSAPGTREVEAIKPVNLIKKVHGILLTGGSAFGLEAAGGVLRFLEEKGIGYDVGVAKVPIVPAAVIFDLRVGRADRRPDKAMGYEAAAAASRSAPEEGLRGVGIGASSAGISGELKGRGGFGTLAASLPSGIVVGTMVVANPLGNVVDPETGKALTGTLDRSKWSNPKRGGVWIESTVLGVIATNASLGKEEATKVAQMAHDGIARAVLPSHTMFDGDVIFAVSTGNIHADVSAIGDMAAELVTKSIMRAVKKGNEKEL